MVCAFALAMLVIGAGCGGSDGDLSAPAQADSDTAQDTPVDDEATPDADADTSDDDTSDDDTAVGFGELMEGTFVLTGAEEKQYDVGDDQLAFRVGGGCEAGNFGMSIQVTDPGGTIPYAMFTAQMEEDLSGGVTGEFDDVEVEVTVFPEGDTSLAETYKGLITMVISEHDTGGANSDFNERRMTMSLVGTVSSSSAGDVDVDANYRWVMGCP